MSTYCVPEPVVGVFILLHTPARSLDSRWWAGLRDGQPPAVRLAHRGAWVSVVHCSLFLVCHTHHGDSELRAAFTESDHVPTPALVISHPETEKGLSRWSSESLCHR